VTPLYPQRLAITSPTSGGRSVGIVRSRTKATELVRGLNSVLWGYKDTNLLKGIVINRVFLFQDRGSHVAYQKKELPGFEAMEPTSESGKYAIVDTTYAYVGFKDGYVI
jgi:hypothetical protein